MTEGPKRGVRGPAGDHQRVFVALWPTPEVRARLSSVADDLAGRMTVGRRVVASNFHLTLAFIGSLQTDQVAELARRVDSCQRSEFNWVVDHIGHFEGARVVWAGGPPCAPLLELAKMARAMLDAIRIDYDHKPFAPHVTVLRNVARWRAGDVSIDPQIVWPCRGPTLVRSEQGPNGVTYIPVDLD